MLHQLIFRGHDRQARRLIVAKPSLVNQADTQGFTPLIVAAEYGHISLVAWLIERGADIEAASLYGLTALHQACHRGHAGIVRLLCRYGADALARDEAGATPLMKAVRAGHSRVVRYLLTRHHSPAMVNARGNDRRTALYIACALGRVEATRLLLKAGADCTLTDDEGRSPLDRALENHHDYGHHSAIIGMLEEALAEPQRARLLHRARALGDATHAVAVLAHRAQQQPPPPQQQQPWQQLQQQQQPERRRWPARPPDDDHDDHHDDDHEEDAEARQRQRPPQAALLSSSSSDRSSASSASAGSAGVVDGLLWDITAQSPPYLRDRIQGSLPLPRVEIDRRAAYEWAASHQAAAAAAAAAAGAGGSGSGGGFYTRSSLTQGWNALVAAVLALGPVMVSAAAAAGMEEAEAAAAVICEEMAAAAQEEAEVEGQEAAEEDEVLVGVLEHVCVHGGLKRELFTELMEYLVVGWDPCRREAASSPPLPQI